jgi:hypothetical protein
LDRHDKRATEVKIFWKAFHAGIRDSSLTKEAFIHGGSDCEFLGSLGQFRLLSSGLDSRHLTLDNDFPVIAPY